MAPKNEASTQELIDLCKLEGFEVKKQGKEFMVEAGGLKIKLNHPFSIYSKLYREESNPDLKYSYLKRMHDILWPKEIETWSYWDEVRFREHCQGWTYITYAGGSSTGKSYSAAKISLLFWFSNPGCNTVLIASTTLESLSSRIFGYCIRLLHEIAIPLVFHFQRGMPPKVLFDRNDKIHGIFALAAKQGDDDKAIKDIIGRHPKKGMMVVLDECTDMPMGILRALPNLQSGDIFFQLVGIGNSLSKYDLHGVLSTPKDGWNTVDPLKINKWETTQKNGVCLFFSCYESPAIHEVDLVKRARLAKFFITTEQIEAKQKLYGAESDAFFRFVLGFWRSDAADDVVISDKFIREFDCQKKAEWGGMHRLMVVAGLDPAFSTGGDQCILRLGILGQDISGNILLDFRGEELIFRIRLRSGLNKSAELQIADEVIRILNEYNCNIGNMAVDATGQGRAISEVIRLRAQSLQAPIKIWSTKIGNTQQKSFDVVVRSSIELWTDIRDFIQTNQLRGIDNTTLMQLTSRLVELRASKRVLESKASFKTRIGAINPALAHSPDEADSMALCIQAAKIKFGFTPGEKAKVIIHDTFDLEKWYAAMHAQAKEENHDYYPSADFSSDIGFVDPFSGYRK